MRGSAAAFSRSSRANQRRSASQRVHFLEWDRIAWCAELHGLTGFTGYFSINKKYKNTLIEELTRETHEAVK